MFTKASFTSLLLLASLIACDETDSSPAAVPNAEAEPDGVKAEAPPAAQVRDPSLDEAIELETQAGVERLRAHAKLMDAEGKEKRGEVTLVNQADGVKIVARLENVSPGKHGFHIHEKGDCGAPTDKSMGGHFNPGSHPHMLPDEGNERHMGDLGNIEVGADGKGALEAFVADATLKEGHEKSLTRRAFILHSGEDQGKAKQPSGDAGTPVVCGEIQLVD